MVLRVLGVSGCWSLAVLGFGGVGVWRCWVLGSRLEVQSQGLSVWEFLSSPLPGPRRSSTEVSMLVERTLDDQKL